MHFSRILLAAIGAVILLPSALAQTTKCPQGQREHKDANGKLWCMDSEGRSHEAEQPKSSTPVHSPDSYPRVSAEPKDVPKENSANQADSAAFRLEFAEKGPMCGSLNTESISVEVLYKIAGDAFDRKDYAMSVCLAEQGIKREHNSGFENELGIAYAQIGLWYGADGNRAYHYFMAAAGGGDPFGMLHLSEIYMNGTGTPINPGLSQYWRSQAMQNAEVRTSVAQQEQTNSGGAGYDDRAAQREEEEERYRHVQSGGLGTGCDSSGHCITRVPNRPH